MQKKILISLVMALFVLSACSPAATPKTEMMDQPTETMVENHTSDMMETPSVAMETAATTMSGDDMMFPAYFDVPLTNVNSGETFKITDFSGKVVLVENLAIWCSNCKKQQEQVKLLNAALGMHSDLISIGFDVDPNENAVDLKKYTDNNGFDWVYAVPPQEVVNEISKLYGANFLNPPSTPIFIIDRKGEVHPMPFGIKSAEELKNFIDPFLAEGM